jgi:large subunit ribosomal protein L10
MSKNFDKKKKAVEEIKEKFDRAQAAVLVNYRGLNVEEVTELRKQFREAGAEYKIYKNNLVKIAIAGTAFESLSDDLKGPNAIAFGFDDPIVPAKLVQEFAKKHKLLELKSAVVEGQYCDLEKLSSIANIPSREVLIAKFMGSIKSPISNFVYMAKAIADKKNEENAEA